MTRGFTFFDILLVLLLFCVVALVAVPAALNRRQVEQEVKAVRAVQWVVAAQERFREEALRDVDGDSEGEYGSLDDLLGAGYAGAPFRASAAGREARVGSYGLTVLLPDRDGNGVPPSRNDEVDPDLAEQAYVVIAWPLKEQGSGSRAYSSNQGIAAMEHPDAGPEFSGTESPKAPIPLLAERDPISGRVIADPSYPAPWRPLLRREHVKAIHRIFREWGVPAPKSVQEVVPTTGTPPEKPK